MRICRIDDNRAMVRFSQIWAIFSDAKKFPRERKNNNSYKAIYSHFVPTDEIIIEDALCMYAYLQLPEVAQKKWAF